MSSLPTVPWEPRWTCSELSASSTAATGIAATAATQILWALSGRQFGLTSQKLRPCRRDCLPDTPWMDGLAPWGGWGYPYPAMSNGLWFNLACGGCGDNCTCRVLAEALLPSRIFDVTEVKVDGVVLTGTAYRLDRDPSAAGDVLVRVDGGQWPLCNDLTKADTQTGTWSVTVRHGQDVPEVAKVAVGELACEFLKGFRGGDCRVPEHVVSMARQGVTLQFDDPSVLLERGKLGLVWCDRFLEATNPAGLRRRASTWSPDRLGPRKVGTA